ncbi:hypothetical protein [Shewanella baltica]|uniref:hypothetical protein n=1 Tax=Shewanella baltica TaxID=62322 RepID=UPI0002185AD9|nr:hypothetical protein [Shewanella baltica]AEH12010.1 hypothetical protein Sbal117_0207 [Shewanella baltica OS117]
MIVNNARALSDTLGFEQKSSSLTDADKKNLNDIEQSIKSAFKQEEKLNKALPFTNSEPSPFQTLATFAAHQKEVVRSMVGLSSESAIASALAGSIEAYSKQLELIQGWTNGGVAMFESALWLMLDDIKQGGVQPEELEDLLQIALLEVMINPEKYGLEDWYNLNKEDISHILESTGSGSHGLHEDAYNTPKKLADITRKLYEGILSNGNIPQGSLLGQAMDSLDAAGGVNQLCGQIENNYYDNYGWWDSTGITELSPMLRLFILSESLNQHETMTQKEVEMILNGSIADIDNYINKTFGPGSAGPLTTLSWFLDSTQWQLQTGYGYPNGKNTQIDWTGDGININDLASLYNNFPGRELNDEDIKEINRIGDQVKMIQQTLKYWIQICRDELMAFARNN